MAEAVVKDEAPFPYVAMCSMCVGIVAQCIVFTAPFPFVAFMVVDFGASKSLDTAGYSAGWIAGIYMIGRISSGVAFGILSDKWGRKPCLVLSMFNVAVLGVLFGLSTNYPMALITRCLCGIGNGFMSVCQTVITELVTNKEHETRAFGYVNGAFGLGYIIGPAIGGLLARPALQYPETFSANGLWGHYPYLLPCLICSGIAAAGAVLIHFNVPETMTSSRKVDVEAGVICEDRCVELTVGVNTACNVTHDNKQYGSVNTEETKVIEERKESEISVSDILRDSQLFMIISMNFFFCFFAVMVEEVFPLWCVSSVSRGGLSWSSAQVGLVLFMTGIGLVTFQVTLYGPIMSYFTDVSSTTIFYYQVIAGAIPLILMPVAEYYVRIYLDDNESSVSVTTGVIYTIIVVFYSIHSFLIGMCYASIAMLINSSVSASKRGTMNGMTGTASSLGNFFAPVIGANLFAWIDSREDKNYLHMDGRVVFILCGLLLIGLGCTVKAKLQVRESSF